MRILLALLAFLLSPLFSTPGYAYPELIRHGYGNCTTCHLSPSGGGLLSEYGRALSAEVVSQTSREGESDPYYGIVKTPEWVRLGGDFRGLFLYRDTAELQEGVFLMMQSDFEVGVFLPKSEFKTGFIGTLGFKEQTQPKPFGDYIISRRHYFRFVPAENVYLRAGRFQPTFGINTPDHAIVTKRGLGWDQEKETYNVEASYQSETWNLAGNAIFGRPDDALSDTEKGYSIFVANNVNEHMKPALSFFQGRNRKGSRTVLGPSALLGFTSNFFLLTETDFQWTDQQRKGAVNYEKLGYEVSQGLIPYLTLEFSKLNWSDASSLNQTYGLGVQYFPRPHLEMNLSWQRLIRATATQGQDLAYLLLHFYP